MEIATHLEHLTQNITRWKVWSEQHRVELTSHAVRVDGCLYFFDPIPLTAPARRELLRSGQPAAILLTNANHLRAAAQWHRELKVPVVGGFHLAWEGLHMMPVERARTLIAPWQAHLLPGGAPGEVAFHLPRTNCLVVGDALTNLDKYGLALVPEKYAEDLPLLRESVSRLVEELRPRRLLMAHGHALLDHAEEHLLKLLHPVAALRPRRQKRV